jgi:hypothetical protein
MTYAGPHERELLADARARAPDVLGEEEFARIAAEGAELVRDDRHMELVGRFAADSRGENAVPSSV